jgi:hypothetical protein
MANLKFAMSSTRWMFAWFSGSDAGPVPRYVSLVNWEEEPSWS